MTKSARKRNSTEPTQPNSTPRKGSKLKQRKTQFAFQDAMEKAEKGLQQKQLNFEEKPRSRSTQESVQTGGEPPSEESSSQSIRADTDTEATTTKTKVSQTNPPEQTRNFSQVHTGTTDKGVKGKKRVDNSLSQTCRFRMNMTLPPNETPLAAFCKQFKRILENIKTATNGKVWLGPWDPEHEDTVPILKELKKFPSGTQWNDRAQLSGYLSGYINPKSEGGTYFMKVRFITNDPSIDLTQLGHGLNDSFQNLPFKVNLSRNPIPCQATKVACLGWLFGSSKTISEKTFVPAVRKHLKIPKECSIGVQWRTITNQYGKRPPFNPDAKNAPPSALHVDIDDRFAPIFLSRASELWKKNNKGNKRLPNDIQLRLVPCFTQLQSKAMTPNQQNNVLAMAEKQHYLTMKVFTKFEIPFIKFLDMPLNSENPLTLRRTLMAKAPSGAPTRRLIHNVDPSWANPAITVISTTMNNLAEANEFTATIIPAALHLYGNDAAKWFTAEGISLFENISWDPTSEKAVSHSEADSAAMVAEDLWDIGEAWKSNDERQSERPIHGMNGTTKGPMERPNNAFDNDEDNRSFASLYGRQSDQTTATPLPPTTKKGGNVLLDSETLQQLDKKTEEDSPSKEDYSMSTMGKTTTIEAPHRPSRPARQR